MEGPSQPTRTNPDRLERVPPQSTDAEMSLLGSMMLDSDVIADAIQVLGPEGKDRFYRNDHRSLYQVLVDMNDARKPIDTVTLRQELDRLGLLQEIGGVEYLVQLIESVPSAVNAEYYARIVRDKAMLRDLIQASGELMEMAYAEADTAREILDRAEQRIFDVAGQRVVGQAENLKEILNEVFANLNARGDDYVSGVPTDFYDLDNLIGGLQRGEMIVLAARPSMGKTALGLNMAENIAVNNNRPVLFFSMEQSAQQVAQRILCGRAQLDGSKLRKGRLSEEDIRDLLAISGELEHAPLLIDDTPGMTALELRSKTRRMHQQHGLAAVFIDYLQLMHASRRSDSRQQEVAEISRALKALARELNIPVVVIAQLNRQPEGREGHRPRMSDLRESGAIEQDADVVLLLHREDYYKEDPNEYTHTADLIVAKQRNGPTDTVPLHWNSSLTRFFNHSARPEPIPSDVSDYTPAGSGDTPF